MLGMRFLTDYLAFALDQNDTPSPFSPLSQLPLVIIVGLTGVGKSTVTNLLQTNTVLTLLPNRRRITDAVIITSLQQEDDEPVEPVADRLKRLEYTARYRKKYPGGMAYALSRFVVDRKKLRLPILFDGLRGLDEVRQATLYFPKARFLVLDTPDPIRLSRLLNRGDSFDTANVELDSDDGLLDSLSAIPDVGQVFSTLELQQISRKNADLPVSQVIEKASIIVKERLNYDSEAARNFLANFLPQRRVLVLRTDQYSPEDSVAKIVKWL